MQKISTYLYKNRYQLVADLAGFLTEYKIVYQRQIKVYKGIDNTIEFDIKNADQKRIDLSTLDQDSIQMNVMDHNGYAILSSPYTITPLDQLTLKGIATVTIPAVDIANIDDQFLTFSVSATQDSAPVILYGDTKFGAAGVIELIGTAFPIERGIEKYDDFYGLGSYDNKSFNYSSSAIHLKYRQAVKPNHVHVIVNCTDFIGNIWVEATKEEVVGNEAFTYKGTRLFEETYTSSQSGNIELPILLIEEYKYLRVCWSKLATVTGKVNNFTIEFHVHDPEIPC
jgi:hypothetical protein